jgi:hypothetical protein
MVFWLRNHFTGTSSPIRRVMSTETALFQVIHRLVKSLKHKEIALGAFLDIEGAFNNTSFNTMV